MYLIWIRELEGKERMVFEGVVSTVKQADYAFRALQDHHPEELVLEFELVDEGNFWQAARFFGVTEHTISVGLKGTGWNV